MAQFPAQRMRRLREQPTMRRMAQETRLSPSDFIYPLFVTHGRNVRREVPAMPGVHQISLDHLLREVEETAQLGIPGVLLFGLPSKKDETGTEAYDKNGIVQEAIRVIKKAAPDMLVIGDVCLCEYTSHGHCGIVAGGAVDNDKTLDLLGKMAVVQADAGADVVAPSAMMDGQVGAIRAALDKAGHKNTAILGYSAKYASGFYGPFRVAADSAPQFGDRRGYQMDPASARQAMREIEQDIEEGADMVMVKPALAYLDVIAKARERFDLPLAAYNVSGEYSMVKAAAENEWIDGRRVTMEILTAIKRAGADMLITYHAKEASEWLRGNGL